MCAEVLDNIEADELGISAEERAKRRAVLDKRSGTDLKNKWAQADREKLEAQMASIAPAVTTEVRCHVCTHPHRLWIEQMIVRGYGATKISEAIPEHDEAKKPDRKSITKHTQKHMPLEQATIRATLDEEAKLLQQNVEEGARGAVTDRGMLKVLVRQAYEAAQAGSIAIEARDFIAMIKLLNDIDVKSATGKAEEYERDLGIFLQAIRNVCEDDVQLAIVREVQRLRNYDDIDTEVEAILLEKQKQLPEGEAFEEEDEVSQ